MTPGAQHTPLRVGFFLSSPICLGQYEYVRLDGVVAHLRARHIDPDGYRRRSSSKVVRTDAGGMRVIYHRGVYHASVGLLDSDEPPNPRMPMNDTPETDSTTYKRLEMCLLCDPRLARMTNWKHTPGTGPYKHAAIKLVTHPARCVRFYARADEHMLHELLSGLRALGKKTGIGYGQVESYKITKISDDWSVVWMVGPCGRYRARCWICEMSERLGWHTPYWDTGDARECAPPGARVMLKSGRRLRQAEPV